MQRDVNQSNSKVEGDVFGEGGSFADPSELGAPERGSGVRSGLIWGLSGFVVGAAFWHLVGFWGFVEKIVYNGRPSDESHYVAQAGPQCVELELDRVQGAVVKLPCDEAAPLLNEMGASARGDFLGQRPAPIVRGPRPLRVTSGER